jgi:hypothetical protein
VVFEGAATDQIAAVGGCGLELLPKLARQPLVVVVQKSHLGESE